VTIKSPINGVFYSVETFYGKGAMSSDFTWVYAHLEHAGKSDKMLVLSGEYLKISNIIWTSPNENTICLEGGITNTFRNEVTLSVGGVSETIRNHLLDHCYHPQVPAGWASACPKKKSG
jgi:hypothetical protein